MHEIVHLLQFIKEISMIRAKYRSLIPLIAGLVGAAVPPPPPPPPLNLDGKEDEKDPTAIK
jgi:hypothetical protein